LEVKRLILCVAKQTSSHHHLHGGVNGDMPGEMTVVVRLPVVSIGNGREIGTEHMFVEALVKNNVFARLQVTF